MAKVTHRYDDGFRSKSFRRPEERGTPFGMVLSRIPLYCTPITTSCVSTCAFLPSLLLNGQRIVSPQREEKEYIKISSLERHGTLSTLTF